MEILKARAPPAMPRKTEIVSKLQKGGVRRHFAMYICFWFSMRVFSPFLPEMYKTIAEMRRLTS